MPGLTNLQLHSPAPAVTGFPPAPPCQHLPNSTSAVCLALDPVPSGPHSPSKEPEGSLAPVCPIETLLQRPLPGCPGGQEEFRTGPWQPQPPALQPRNQESQALFELPCVQCWHSASSQSYLILGGNRLCLGHPPTPLQDREAPDWEGRSRQTAPPAPSRYWLCRRRQGCQPSPLQGATRESRP